jgi:hypothetical protein
MADSGILGHFVEDLVLGEEGFLDWAQGKATGKDGTRAADAYAAEHGLTPEQTAALEQQERDGKVVEPAAVSAFDQITREAEAVLMGIAGVAVIVGVAYVFVITPKGG